MSGTGKKRWRDGGVFFGDDFEHVRSLLKRCPGEVARQYPDPDSSGELKMIRARHGWIAYDDQEEHNDGEPFELTETDQRTIKGTGMSTVSLSGKPSTRLPHSPDWTSWLASGLLRVVTSAAPR
jgi:hypothetical protein